MQTVVLLRGVQRRSGLGLGTYDLISTERLRTAVASHDQALRSHTEQLLGFIINVPSKTGLGGLDLVALGCTVQFSAVRVMTEVIGEVVGV